MQRKPSLNKLWLKKLGLTAPRNEDTETLPLREGTTHSHLNNNNDFVRSKSIKHSSSPLKNGHNLKRISAPSTFSFEVEYVGPKEPSGEWYQASFHLLTAVLGAGILAIPYSLKFLNFGGGLLYLGFVTLVSLYTSRILAYLHETPDGNRLNTYEDIGLNYLGKTFGNVIIFPTKTVACIGLCIAYTLAAGQSLQAIASPSCILNSLTNATDRDEVECSNNLYGWIAVYTVVQMFLSQVEDLHSLWLLSLAGSIMSVIYSSIAVLCSIIHIAQDGIEHVEYSLKEIPKLEYAFGLFNAIGTIMFCFGGQSVQLEIQATITRPSTTKMNKALYVSYGFVMVAYFSVAVTGFAAFGNAVNPDILFSIAKPIWLVKAANVMLVVHVLASFQLFAHLVFDVVEKKIFCDKHAKLLNVFNRMFFCITCAAIATTLPYFNDLLGIIGSVGIIPLCFVYPSLIYIASGSCESKFELVWNYFLVAFMSIICILSLVGSIFNIIFQVKTNSD